jgi:PAS domain
MYRPDGASLPHDKCPMADILRDGIAVIDQEVVIERPDGSRCVALVNIRPVKDGGGNITGAVNCFYDITGRKHVKVLPNFTPGVFDPLAHHAALLGSGIGTSRPFTEQQNCDSGWGFAGARGEP